MLERDIAQLRCPDCKSLNVKNSTDPFASKRLAKNWKKKRIPAKQIKNFGLQILKLEDTSRQHSKAFSRMNTNTYGNYKA